MGFVYYVYYTVYCYNKVTKGKENVTKEIISKCKYVYNSTLD